MQRVRMLVRRVVEAVYGKCFPRLVTAPNGTARWENNRGRTFRSREEAS